MAIMKINMFADERRQRIYEWLSAPDPSISHNTVCEKRQSGTGSWFIEGEFFKEWKSHQNSFLWLQAIRMSLISLCFCESLIDCQ
jgi:hypothetical protein